MQILRSQSKQIPIFVPLDGIGHAGDFLPEFGVRSPPLNAESGEIALADLVILREKVVFAQWIPDDCECWEMLDLIYMK